MKQPRNAIDETVIHSGCVIANKDIAQTHEIPAAMADLHKGSSVLRRRWNAEAVIEKTTYTGTKRLHMPSFIAKK